MDVWPRCLQRLETEFPPEDVRTWLKPLQADRRERQLVLYAPNAFVMEEVRSHYLARIRELAAYFGDAEVNLDIGTLRRVDAQPSTPTKPDSRVEQIRMPPHSFEAEQSV